MRHLRPIRRAGSLRPQRPRRGPSRSRRGYAEAVAVARSAKDGDALRAGMAVLAALHLADTDQRAEAATAVRRTGGLYRLTSCDRLLAPY